MTEHETVVTDQPAQTAEMHYAPVRLAAKAKWLTFEYALAMFSTVVASVLTTLLIIALMEKWSSSASLSATKVLLDGSVVGTLTLAMLAVLLAGVAFVLFGRVTRSVAEERAGYTGRLAYKLTTYGSLFVLIVVMLPLIANLASVLVSSLLLIGVDNAGAVYSNLYLANFLPSLVSLTILMGVAFCVAKIVCGVNKSRLMAIGLVAVTAVVAVAMAITLAVKAHDTDSRATTQIKRSLESTPYRQYGD